MRDVVITGIGLVSSAGRRRGGASGGASAGAPPHIDAETFAPFPVHPAVGRSNGTGRSRRSPTSARWSPGRSSAATPRASPSTRRGAKDDAALKSRMQLIVAAGGGERDYAVDGQILTGLREADNPGVFLNERLMGDLRPTLFLAQLSNLLAGNISIVHGVTGASRTFMGEEASGVDAIRIAHARIASGQNDIFLVGGAYNAERPDVLLIYEMGGFLWKQPYRARLGTPRGGRRHDSRQRAPASWCSNRASTRDARGAKPLAADRWRRLRPHPARRPGSVETALDMLWRERSRPSPTWSSSRARPA